MDEFLVALQPQAGELLLEEVLDRFYIVVGRLFDFLDPLGVLEGKVGVEAAQIGKCAFRYAGQLGQLRTQSAQGVATKSGLMVGLGESDDEVLQTLHDLRDAGVGIVTLGQYLRPTLEHYPVAAYITPEKFEWYRLKALEMGFSYCASAPLVRSSYMAEEALKSVKSL